MSDIDRMVEEAQALADGLAERAQVLARDAVAISQELKEKLGDKIGELGDVKEGIADEFEELQEKCKNAEQELEESKRDVVTLFELVTELAELAFPNDPNAVEYMLRRVQLESDDFGTLVARLRTDAQQRARPIAKVLPIRRGRQGKLALQ